MFARPSPSYVREAGNRAIFRDSRQTEREKANSQNLAFLRANGFDAVHEKSAAGANATWRSLIVVKFAIKRVR